MMGSPTLSARIDPGGSPYGRGGRIVFVSVPRYPLDAAYPPAVLGQHAPTHLGTAGMVIRYGYKDGSVVHHWITGVRCCFTLSFHLKPG
jgi:hypothetical protein